MIVSTPSLLLLASLASLAGAQRFFKTKFEDCDYTCTNLYCRINFGYCPSTGGVSQDDGSLQQKYCQACAGQVEFCSLTVDGCEGAEPACSAMKAGDNIKLCSSLTVPTQSPDVNVQVTWKVLLENNSNDECETTYDLDDLRSKGKFPLVCIKIPARVQVPRG